MRLIPTNATIKCEYFPVTLRGVKGTVLATPQRVEIKDLASRHGAASVSVSGVIVPSKAGHDVTLKLSGANLPIDKELIAALGIKPQRVANSRLWVSSKQSDYRECG